MDSINDNLTLVNFVDNKLYPLKFNKNQMPISNLLLEEIPSLVLCNSNQKYKYETNSCRDNTFISLIENCNFQLEDQLCLQCQEKSFTYGNTCIPKCPSKTFGYQGECLSCMICFMEYNRNVENCKVCLEGNNSEDTSSTKYKSN